MLLTVCQRMCSCLNKYSLWKEFEGTRTLTFIQAAFRFFAGAWVANYFNFFVTFTIWSHSVTCWKDKFQLKMRTAFCWQKHFSLIIWLKKMSRDFRQLLQLFPTQGKWKMRRYSPGKGLVPQRRQCHAPAVNAEVPPSHSINLSTPRRPKNSRVLFLLA